MSDELPTPVWSGTVRILDVDLRVHVLDDGRRIVEEESVIAFCNALAGSENPERCDVQAFAEFVSGRGIP